MILIEYVYIVKGDHTHTNVFAGEVTPDSGYSLGKCGSLIFRNEEFTAFKQAIEASEAEHRDEGLVIQFIEHKHD